MWSFISKLFLLINIVACLPPQLHNYDNGGDKHLPPPTPHPNIPLFKLNLNNTTNNNNNKPPPLNTVLANTAASAPPPPESDAAVPNIINIKPVEMESGAVLRGVLVFVAISVLFMIYVAYQNYRNRNHRNRTATAAVRKYGVRARRTDTEMMPLPLDDDDDDDDETVFELSHLSRK